MKQTRLLLVGVHWYLWGCEPVTRAPHSLAFHWQKLCTIRISSKDTFKQQQRIFILKKSSVLVLWRLLKSYGVSVHLAQDISGRASKLGGCASCHDFYSHRWCYPPGKTQLVVDASDFVWLCLWLCHMCLCKSPIHEVTPQGAQGTHQSNTSSYYTKSGAETLFLLSYLQQVLPATRYKES